MYCVSAIELSVYTTVEKLCMALMSFTAVETKNNEFYVKIKKYPVFFEKHFFDSLIADPLGSDPSKKKVETQQI
jgi:hypothetical protein